MMSRSFKLFMFLAAFYSATADAVNYGINVTFATGPDQPTRIVLSNQYCMSKVPDVVGLKEGKAVIYIDTDGGIFSKCGWVHSSATFVAQNSKKETKLVFEFYRDVATKPYLKILRPAHANCEHSVAQRATTPSPHMEDSHLRGNDHKPEYSETPPPVEDTFYLVCHNL